MVLAVGEVIVASTILLCCRSVLGFAFGNELEVVDYVKEMSPLLCLSLIMDSLQAVLSGYNFTSVFGYFTWRKTEFLRIVFTWKAKTE